MKNLVSVIIPSFNNASYIGEAIDSCLKQTMPIYEILIIDNYSTDNTANIINIYKKKYKNIHFYQFKNNGVVAKSRNYGIKLSKGNVIAFLDSDDYWFKKKLQTCISEFDSGFDIVCHSVLNQKRYNHLNKKINFLLVYLNPNIVTPSSLIYKKDKNHNINFNENKRFNTSEDYFLILNELVNEKKIKFINKDLSYYRIHSNNLSKASLRLYLAELNTIKYFFKLKSLKYKITNDIYYFRISRIYLSKFKHLFFQKKLYLAKKNLTLFFYFFIKFINIKIFKNKSI